MTLTSLLIASEEQLAPLIAPPLVIAGVAALAFFMMGLVTFAYRDVANRQAQKRSSSTGQAGAHDGAQH
ncbi:hypothetical protein OVN18_00860 [Microcella daejeonensis]|jgi:hypothetical protein|uniref:Uncharacterized protein n=1 Tax=Microcella daejeonensis TaxID=2994971 RepID=A0A9E8SBI4_9MICO|nr:hypothetical protein [Microcella daejeonensis]WAB81607.1 hypothetical protein OVN18_00860 [Microcella daejeonensis]WAB83755.1 hypothetical protein OVN20_12035 [Microcella daejeonensis]